MAGQYPNNTANILNSTIVCNSVVHLIDRVLLPTNSTQTIPAPGNGLNQTLAGTATTASNATGALFPGLK